MAETTSTLLIELLTWLSSGPRTYDETMVAWQSHCPRQTIWEDAIIGGLVEVQQVDDPRSPEVVLTPAGQAFINEQLFQARRRDSAR